MTEISGQKRSLWFLLFFLSISLLLVPGFSTDSSNPKNGTKADTHTTSSTGTGSRVVIICLVLVAVVFLSFFLFKLWQKKKREEQYARLLKLFEEDDELEFELGLRD
ncbi:uncharacterized protein LOC132300527 [Cornus florida]|uniref:uncharacterized protein LOC132300527 n=1 Tax=Cornus florida TaxID=4283 RepID=UPI00289C1597|nr:uncharacterized protein LOC132300527 [Cornus florida]